MRAVTSLLLRNKCTWEEVSLPCTGGGGHGDVRGYYGMHRPQVLIGAVSKAWIRGMIGATNPVGSSGSGSAHCAGLIQK